MTKRFQTLSFWTLFMIWICSASLSHLNAQSSDGLFAVFKTNQGEFTCELYYKETPRTVANFISLAEGTRPWIDFEKASVSNERFYQNTTFHRVIKDFMIQAGSRNGLGTDGPGYRFRDELRSDLKHDSAGILSMAKTAQPHTNGSQFFVTLGPTPWLDNVHTVFGKVSEGQSIVNQIGGTATGLRDQPIEPQMILDITILRVGQDALDFDPLTITPPLPHVRPTPITIERSSGAPNIVWTVEPNRQYHAFFGSDFETWTTQSIPPIGKVSLQSIWNNSDIHFFLFFEAEADQPAQP